MLQFIQTFGSLGHPKKDYFYKSENLVLGSKHNFQFGSKASVGIQIDPDFYTF